MHIFTHERHPCTQTLELKTIAIVTRDGKRAWRRTGVSKGVLRACLSRSSCQHVLRACHGESGSDQSVCKNCPPCLPAFNGLQHKIKHIDHTLIRKHGACKGNMWDTWGHPEGITPSAEATSDWIQKIFIPVSYIEIWNIWNGSLQQDFLEITADVIPVVKMPRFDQNMAKGNESPAHSTSNGNSEM